MDEQPVKEQFGIISPELDCRTFQIGEATYQRSDTLALCRHRLLEKLITELQYEANYRGLVETFMKGWGHLEAGRLGSGIAEFGLMREKLNLIGANRYIPAEIVGLFFLGPNESGAEFSYEQLKQKVYTEWAALDRDWLKKKAYDLVLSTETRYPEAPEAEVEKPLPES